MPKVWNATYDAYEPTNSAPIAISFRLHEEKYYEEMAVEIYKAEKVNPSAYGHTGLKPEEIIEKYRKILSAQDYHSRESQKDLERALSKLPSTFYFAPNLGEAFKNTEELSALCDPKEGQRTEWERHAHLFSIRNKKILVLDEWAEVTIKRAHQITCAAVAESREVLNTTAGDKK
jgi:DNA-binding Lrp family transcriptional regulator